MITAFTVLFTFTCLDPQLINESNDPWNKSDKQTLEQASKRCSEIYPDAPCIKKFIKKEPTNYWVICTGSKA